MKILIAFPETLFGKLIFSSLALQRDVEILAYFASAQEMLYSPLPMGADLAVISADSNTRQNPGFELLRRIRRFTPDTRPVVIFEHITKDSAIAAFSSGARGILSISTCDAQHLFKCLQVVNAGQVWADTAQVGWMLDALKGTPEKHPATIPGIDEFGEGFLSRRERDVVRFLAEGQTNRSIANSLNLSEHTVKKYLLRIFEKAGVSSRTELMAHAIKAVRRVSAESVEQFRCIGPLTARESEVGCAK